MCRTFRACENRLKVLPNKRAFSCKNIFSCSQNWTEKNNPSSRNDRQPHNYFFTKSFKAIAEKIGICLQERINLEDVTLKEEMELREQVYMYTSLRPNSMKHLRFHCVEEKNGTFNVSLNLMLNSKITGTWRATACTRATGTSVVIQQCLEFLSNHPLYFRHFHT